MKTMRTSRGQTQSSKTSRKGMNKFTRRAIAQHKELALPQYRHRVIKNRYNDVDILIAKKEIEEWL